MTKVPITLQWYEIGIFVGRILLPFENRKNTTMKRVTKSLLVPLCHTGFLKDFVLAPIAWFIKGDLKRKFLLMPVNDTTE